MSRWMSRAKLIDIIDGDKELISVLVEHGIVVERPEGFDPRQVERVLVSRTLVRQLDVNIEGVEIIVRLRERLIATHDQVGTLLNELSRAYPDKR